MGTVDITLELSGDRYRISSLSRSQGFLDFLLEIKRQNDVSGRINGDAVKPTNYRTKGTVGGEVRSVMIDFSKESGIVFEAVPTALEDEREIVPRALLSGVTDPLSAMYSAIRTQQQRGHCKGRRKVFDGRRRYDLFFEDIGRDEISGPLFSGPAQICRMRQNVISGLSQRRWLPRISRPEWTEIWIAEVRTGLPGLPVRLQADAGLGDMVTHLVAIGERRPPKSQPEDPTETFEDDERR